MSPLEICISSSAQEIRPSLTNFRNLNARAYRDQLLESLSTTHCVKKKKRKKKVPSIVAHTCGPSTQEAEAEGLEV